MLEGYGTILFGVASVFLVYGVYVIVGKTRDAAAAALEAYSPSSFDKDTPETDRESDTPKLPPSPPQELVPTSAVPESVMYYRTLARLADNKID
jgi:hypothetical protein